MKPETSIPPAPPEGVHAVPDVLWVDTRPAMAMRLLDGGTKVYMAHDESSTLLTPEQHAKGKVKYVPAEERDQAVREREEARADLMRALGMLETERLRLAACGCLALANTPESAVAMRAQMKPEYRSGSSDDVIAAVDREMALRSERDSLQAEVAREKDRADALREALRELIEDLELRAKIGTFDGDHDVQCSDGVYQRARDTLDSALAAREPTGDAGQVETK